MSRIDLPSTKADCSKEIYFWRSGLSLLATVLYMILYMTLHREICIVFHGCEVVNFWEESNGGLVNLRGKGTLLKPEGSCGKNIKTTKVPKTFVKSGSIILFDLGM